MLDNVKVFSLLLLFILGFVLYKPTNTTLPIPPVVSNILNFFTQQGSSIMIVVLVIITILVYAQDVGWDFNPPTNDHLEQVLIAENMSNRMEDGICVKTKNDLHEREQNCNQLTKGNCDVSDCCIFLNGKKCVAGDAHGPVYRSDDDGNKLDIDKYYFTPLEI